MALLTSVMWKVPTLQTSTKKTGHKLSIRNDLLNTYSFKRDELYESKRGPHGLKRDEFI